MGNCASPGDMKEDFSFVLKNKYVFLSDETKEPEEQQIKILESQLEGMKFTNPEDDYEKISLIGKGSYGEVFMVKKKKDKTNSFYASKIISCTNEDQDTIKKILNEVRKEVAILKDLDHPNIIKYFESYYYKTKFWIVLEYCAGGSLLDYIEICKEGLNEQAIQCVCISLLRGLAFLHTKKPSRIHRDVKAGNILLNRKGEIKLADFGVSAQLQNRGERRKSLEGSSFWLAPEVLNYETYNEKADIWSLGITLIELAEMYPPYYEQTTSAKAVFEKISNNPPPTFKNKSNFSEKLNDFLSQCLQKSHTKRPSAVQLLRHPFILQDLEKEDTEIMKEIVKKIEEKGGVIEFNQNKKKKKKK